MSMKATIKFFATATHNYISIKICTNKQMIQHINHNHHNLTLPPIQIWLVHLTVQVKFDWRVWLALTVEFLHIIVKQRGAKWLSYHTLSTALYKRLIVESGWRWVERVSAMGWKDGWKEATEKEERKGVLIDGIVVMTIVVSNRVCRTGCIDRVYHVPSNRFTSMSNVLPVHPMIVQWYKRFNQIDKVRIMVKVRVMVRVTSMSNVLPIILW